MDFSLRFAKPPVCQIPELVSFSDASHYRDRVDDSRIGMLVFRSWGIGAGSVFHSLYFATSFAAWPYHPKVQTLRQP
jgi:hypothetical protein